MRAEDAVRAEVAPLIWRGNPHSASLAASALALAGLADTGRDVEIPLSRTLAHLADCSPDSTDVLDELRAAMARRFVEWCRSQQPGRLHRL